MTVANVTTKACNKCGTVTDQYYSSNKSRCKSCICAGVREDRKINGERYRKGARDRRKVNPQKFKDQALASRARNIENIREYDKKRSTLDHRVQARKDYSLTEDGKAAHLKSLQKMRNKWPDKYKARNAVASAIKNGSLNKPDKCSRCEETLYIEGHHPDYTKQLEVIWLCQKCHREEHN